MNSENTILLIDNSNSRTKFRLCINGKVGDELRILPTNQITEERVNDALSDWCFSSACICSVVPETAAVLRSSFSCPVRFVTAHDNLPVDFSCYEGRATLGADRIANAVGALDWGHLPVVAVDLGSAVTFDVVVRGEHGKPCFIGGVIAPGLPVFYDYLGTRTALLPRLTHRCSSESVHIGQNTEQAMRCGLEAGGKGMLRGILSDIESDLGVRPFVIATGGDAFWAAKCLSEINLVDPMLTFRGLACVAKTES